MWETDWATPPPDGGAGPERHTGTIDPDSVDLAYVLFWMEHCIECAIPDCYSTCPLYVARRDRKCARLRYGIHPNPAFRGLFDFGADVHFRRWGKLESKLTYGTAAPSAQRALAARDRRMLRIVNPIAASLEPLNPERRLNGAYTLLRDARLSATRNGGGAPRLDELVVEVFNPGEPVALIVEVHQDRPRFRCALPLARGWNLHRVPFESLDVDLGRHEGRILVYPENDAEVRLIFTWLDLVRYRAGVRPDVTKANSPATEASAVSATPVTGAVPAHVTAAAPRPAATLKCVVWDLDNTLWKGVLIEDGPDGLVPVPEALELVRRLDERGIIQSVASKNDHDQAMEQIRKIGLEDYFIAPAIHWGPKSKSLERIAETLNIGIDTLALVDDSAFERGEVSHALPQVRVYRDDEIATLLDRAELDVPVTEESRQRRASYLAEGRRREIAAQYGDDYVTFLESCAMTAELFPPVDERHRERCLELVQRSNQLNLSTRRYDRTTFDALLDDPGVLALAFACRDRFGDYGTVGFLAVALDGDVPVLRDLVISCRVAQKRVENAVCHWLAGALAGRGHERLHAHYRPTARNGVLRQALLDSGFVARSSGDGVEVLELSFERPVPDGAVVTVDAARVPPLAGRSPAGRR